MVLGIYSKSFNLNSVDWHIKREESDIRMNVIVNQGLIVQLG
jgi:hypothetical protein